MANRAKVSLSLTWHELQQELKEFKRFTGQKNAGEAILSYDPGLLRIQLSVRAASASRASPERRSPSNSCASGGSACSCLPGPLRFSRGEVIFATIQPQLGLGKHPG